ncbi:MAG: RNA-binding protein, partial [Bacteroidetes bacterium]|nr:RNA-binding protein [Fibrella sp.]
RRRFPYFKDFTQASIDKLLTPEERKSALVLEANYLQSVYVENTGNGSFVLHPLPTQAQLAPIFGMVAQDVDRDGNLDVMLVGNDFSAELLMGRYDAMNGLWLKGDGKGGFAPQTIASSGFYVPGNAKGLAQLTDAQGRNLLVATQNRGPLRVFRTRQTDESVRLQPTDVVALLTHAQGRTERVELSYGSSYLSQSDRTLRIGSTIRRVDIIDSKGKKRMVTPTAKPVAKR